MKNIYKITGARLILRSSGRGGCHYYIVYEAVIDGRKATRIQKVHISGRLIRAEKGTFINRLGKRIVGIKFTYEGYLRSTIGRRGRLRGSRIPLKLIYVKKVIQLPIDSNIMGIYSYEALPEEYKKATQKA